ncbi:MAG: hypothetical protein IPH75_05295 [bacterium]|nr:hypothetical protein [bacterium]
MPARYGNVAKRAGEEILFAETEIMVESGRRAEKLEASLKKVDKRDWGTNGDKLYDHIIDPGSDVSLQPGSLEAVQEIRKFMENDRKEIISIKREKLRKAVTAIAEKTYRQENSLEGKKLSDLQRAELADKVELALSEKVPADWGVVNYLPQLHPGSWEIVRDGQHVGSAHTAFDAMLRAIEDYANHPEVSPESYSIRGRAFRGGDVVRIGRPRFHKIVNEIADAAEGSVTKEQVAQFLSGEIGTKEAKQKSASSRSAKVLQDSRKICHAFWVV